MRLLTRTLAIFILTLFLAVGSVGAGTGSQEITLEDALAWGMRHSGALQKPWDQMEQLQTNLTNMKLALSWQFDLQGGVNYGTLPPQLRTGEDETSTQADLSLQGSKSYLWGLNLRPKLSYSERDPLEWDQLSDNLNFSITATQSLFLWGQSQQEQEYIQTANQYQQARENFIRQVESEMIGWISNYLNLLRLEERRQVALVSLQQAEEHVARVEEEREVGEASEINLLTAQIQLKQAQSRFHQAFTNFQHQKQAWYNQLNLPRGQEVVLTISNSYLAEVESQLAPRLMGSEGQLLDKIYRQHQQLKANHQDQQLTQKQISWAKQKGLPQVSLTGSYDYQKENWNAGIQIGYQLTQKQNRLKVNDLEKKLARLQTEEQRLKRDLRLKLQQQLNQIDLSQLTSEEKQLATEKARLEAELATRQREAGLITQQEVDQRNLSYEQALIDLKAAEDQHFVNRMRLFNLLGYRLPTNSLGGK